MLFSTHQVTSAGKSGVIVFSFGLTGFDPNVVPKKFRHGSLEALSELDQKVVLHFDPDKLDFIPDNVLARQMIPQQDLLGKASKIYHQFLNINNHF